MQKIELESLYTPYTLDTYSTFTMEDADEVLELAEDADVDYDVDGYLADLAKNRLKLLRKNILDDVILTVNGDQKVIRPKEYNFTTDKTWDTYTIDNKKLDAFINANSEDYTKNKLKDSDGFWWLGDEWQTKLNYYLYKKSAKDYPANDYYTDQLEDVPSIEYVTINKLQ